MSGRILRVLLIPDVGMAEELVLNRFFAWVCVEVRWSDRIGSGWVSSLSERVRSMTSGDGIKSSR